MTAKRDRIIESEIASWADVEAEWNAADAQDQLDYYNDAHGTNLTLADFEGEM
jgi:hypothetical protein